MIEKENQKENQKTTPKVEKLEDLVAYQKGSVVSREIIRKSTGTATVFAFDLGQGLSEHTAPFDALVHIIDGQAEISISGKIIKNEKFVIPKPMSMDELEEMVLQYGLMD